MKTPSQDLFLLIQSMTKAEKRYFSQFAKQHILGKQNNYYTLFKIIDSQTVYNEILVRKAMEKQGVYQHFTALKFQLMERILETLHNFHQKNSIAETIKRELHFCKILLDKNLIETAIKRLDKTQKTIKNYDLSEFSPELFNLKRAILTKNFYRNTNIEAIETLYESMTTTVEQLQNWNEYERINAFIQKNHYQKIHSNTLDFEELNNNQWLNNPAIPTTFRSKMIRLSALATLNFMQGKTAIAYEHNQAFVQLLEASPKMTELYANNYFAVLSNLLIDSLILDKQADLEKGIQKLRKITTSKVFQKQIPNLELQVFRQTYLLEMNYAISNKDFQKGIALIETIEEGLKRHEKTIGLANQITFHYLFAYCYFCTQQYSSALTYLNKILLVKEKIATEIIEFANLLNVLTHFELNNYDLLEYLIPSTRRLLRKKRALYKTEDLVLSHLKKITNTIEKSKQNQLWVTFEIKIMELKSDKNEQRVFNYFDFVWWLETMNYSKKRR